MGHLNDDIIVRLKTISGNSIVAWSITHTLNNNEMNAELIKMLVSQIKDQIHDNPELMQEILSPEDFHFFSNIYY
ncbi:hypothetical protein ACFOW1_13335 [Parasediminibacterium paludis]|uniref:Uncharacterized protein n=1 Tax=Parasediminibacterium paludis TaxID=908966 RepID=A0ABV8PZ93_9BACT